MSNSSPQPPSPKRSCGGCTLCCKALAIKELNKPLGVACQHICSSGCAVQDQRATNDIYFGCNTYNCLWLLGDLQEKDRPDKIKAVFTALPHPNPAVKKPMVLVNEAYVGSSDSGRAKELIDGFVRTGYSVVVKNPQYSTEYYPDGTVVRFRIDLKDPLLMKYDPEAKPIQLRVGGRLL
jgi:hypothetical protein